MRGVVDEIFPGVVAVGKNLRQTQIRIVPRLAELGQGQGCRVFQNLTVVEIAKRLFKLWHIEIDVRLHPEPLKREYCTQVNDIDFDFLSRNFAEDGIHGESGIARAGRSESERAFSGGVGRAI